MNPAPIVFPHSVAISHRNASLEEQARLNAVALRLAKLEAKTAVIRRYSGLATMKARGLFTEITGRRPPSGGGHVSSVSIVKKSPLIHLHATIFAVTLHNVVTRGDNANLLAGEQFLEAYDVYCEQVRVQSDVNPVDLVKRAEKKPDWRMLDINAAALIAADLATQASVLEFCKYCNTWYFKPTEQTVGQLLEQQVSLTLQDAANVTRCPMCRIREETLHHTTTEK